MRTATEQAISFAALRDDAKDLAEAILEALSSNGEFNARTSPFSLLDIRRQAAQFLREHRRDLE